MPYRIIKKVKQATIRSYRVMDHASNFCVELDDDKTWKSYPLYDRFNDSPIFGLKILGEASQLLDENGKRIRSINKSYYFETECVGYQKQFFGIRFGSISEERFLFLPRDLFLDFAIEEGMSIDLLLREIVVPQKDEPTIIPIYKEVLKLGPMDVVPKDDKGEIIPSSKIFIETDFTDDYYSSLVIEINRAYGFGLYTSTLVLTRKLFENLLVDLFLARFDVKVEDERRLFYDDEKHMHHSLSVLIPNLRHNSDKFLTRTFADEELYRFLDKIKEKADASAHSVEIQPDPNMIDSWKPQINEYSKLILWETTRMRKSQ